MNQYGAQARRHWQTHRPIEFQQMTDPEGFFSDLGEQISEQIDQLALSLEGQDPPGETFLEKVGRLNMAKLTATEQVLREMLPPAEDEDQMA